jgi:hypothetical protein
VNTTHYTIGACLNVNGVGPTLSINVKGTGPIEYIRDGIFLRDTCVMEKVVNGLRFSETFVNPRSGIC